VGVCWNGGWLDDALERGLSGAQRHGDHVPAAAKLSTLLDSPPALLKSIALTSIS
jgi:hypothetical protein